MTKFLMLVFLVACAGTPPGLPPEAVVTEKQHASAKEARNFIKNKRNYFHLLFEQSFDPYYRTPRWPEDCLRKNSVGEIRERHGNTFFLSRFLLNAKNEPGHCEGQETEVIYLHCENALESYEIRCRPGACEKVFQENPCPLRK